jgi:ABC-2 type transport system ATP-binding protein
VVSLLGPNGAGKTTAIRILLGLARPTSGQAWVLGADPRLRSTRVRIGTMLQVGKVPETLTVREHVRLFSAYYPRPRPYQEVLDAAGLRDFERRRYGELSGGQQQRVLFALAICGNPDVIFLDEPTVGLDVQARRAIWDMIRMVVADGASVVLTTHYLDEADLLSDRIVVLARGRRVASGTPTEIKSTVATKTVRCTTVADGGSLEAISGVRSVRREGRGLILQVARAEPVVRALLEIDPDLADLEIEGAQLEEAFLELTEEGERS